MFGGSKPSNGNAILKCMADCKTEFPVFERHFTPAELGKTWCRSPNTVRRWAEEVGGIQVIDRLEQRFKRGYKSIRIPESTAAKIYALHFKAAA